MTGAPGGVIVLDVDGPTGARTLLGLGRGPGALPRTWCARTGRGLHLYYRYPGFVVRNRVGLLPGLDLRGDGGYAVAPPSRHPDGQIYRWVWAPEEVPLAEAPDWLLRLIRPHKPAASPRRPRRVPPGSGGIEAALPSTPTPRPPWRASCRRCGRPPRAGATSG